MKKSVLSVLPQSSPLAEEEDGVKKTRPNGWKCMPFIIGNETFEKVASLGLMANFTVYLVNNFHMQQVSAAQLSNIFGGTTNFAPVVGAFVSDAYWGRFRTLAYSSVASFLGMIIMTLTATLPQLRPASCTPEAERSGDCPPASHAQLGVLLISLVFLAVGAGGVRPCSLPFGVDQFDRNTEQGRLGIDSFFNWYYCTSAAAAVIALTVMVYIQGSVSWAVGFGIPTALMLVAILLFFSGMGLYEYVPPEGSVFSGTAQVFVAAFRKRSIELPAADDMVLQDSMLCNRFDRSERVMKLPLTLQFRFLNKAAIKGEGELRADGSVAEPWRLCNIQQIEEVKCLLRIVPLWASGIVCFVAMAQQWTFAILQSLTMDRHLGPSFQIPPATIGSLSILALALFIPIYDQLLVPLARRVTGQENGITLLQRQGAGLVVSAVSMVVAGLVEERRRRSAVAHGGLAPMSAMWLAPQLMLGGIAEAFNAVGQIEFYNRQFPEHMQTLAGSLFYCSLAGSNYLSTVLVSIVQRNSGWLSSNNLNEGRLDYFYYVIAGMGVVNFVYFLVCAHFYRYKGQPEVNEEGAMVVNTEKAR